jgi:hypothetical protein
MSTGKKKAQKGPSMVTVYSDPETSGTSLNSLL